MNYFIKSNKNIVLLETHIKHTVFFNTDNIRQYTRTSPDMLVTQIHRNIVVTVMSSLRQQLFIKALVLWGKNWAWCLYWNWTFSFPGRSRSQRCRQQRRVNTDRARQRPRLGRQRVYMRSRRSWAHGGAEEEVRKGEVRMLYNISVDVMDATYLGTNYFMSN